jgi:cysteine desulfurase
MIYLDHAAATPLDPRVFAAMRPFFDKEFGNASSIHALGRRAKEAAEEGRKQISQILGAQADEIIFTGSATEANNLAILGCAWARKNLGNHLIVSSIEHASLMEPCEQLAKEGFKITYLPVDKFGLVNPERVKKAITDKTILVSVMYANNEVGTIEPVAEIGRLISHLNKERAVKLPSPRIYFHTDAVQAANYLELNVNRLHADLLTLNASKIYGPKGAGLLYKKRGLKIKPLIWGGGQERGWRGGTENVAAIVGLAAALRLVQASREKEATRLRGLRDYFWQGLKRLPLPQGERAGVRAWDLKLNGHPEFRLPNNLHISLPGIDGEALLIYLDEAGVQCSTGAACSLIEESSSRVLKAIGVPKEQIQSSLRFTLGRSTTKREIDQVLKILPAIIDKNRRCPIIHYS